MKITFLDAATLGEDIKCKIQDIFGNLGDVCIRDTTTCDEVAEAVNSEVVVVNKIKLNEKNLKNANRLKLICLAATGFDNVDIDWCRANNIAVCNVCGYSTYSVAQLTIAMALMLVNHMYEYNEYVKSGKYSRSGVANRLVPVFHELHGKTWGIVGAGNIGKQVARVAEALGCKIIVNKRTDDGEYEFCDIDTLCKTSDVISVHTPLTDETRNLINKKRIDSMKDDVIFINVSRGAVADEAALTEALEKGHIGGLGIDVYGEEPMSVSHPYNRIMNYPNACFTPHNGWGAYESRVRCLEIIKDNIESFIDGGRKNRVD